MVRLSDALCLEIDTPLIDGVENWGALAPLISNITENSPYLARLLQKEGDWLFAQKDQAVEDVFAALFEQALPEVEAELARHLRVMKGRIALYLAVLDLGRVLPVLEVTRYLSEFADFACQNALGFLLNQAVERGKLPENVRGEECGIFALAMGKGGAFELNYSSDIDLILFFDASRFAPDALDIRKSFIRVAQAFVKLLSDVTKDGYVFRTDLRLRPDPAVTPVVISTDQALGYYELLGRTWERAAFIKARVCAGDFEAGEGFLQELTPFIWRKHLDFAAIEDAHNMRLRIRQHKGLEGPIVVQGHNLKLGRGGIREIEFFTQTRQLIFGGRQADLRLRPSCDALDALASLEIIEADLAEYLKQEYLWLRRLEHAAQMIDDRQTHLVPEGENYLKFLNLLGVRDRDGFEAEFVERLQKIDATMERFFAGSAEEVPSLEADFDGIEVEMIEGWMSLPALRSERARGIFARLRPQILEKLGASAHPQDALRNFDRFLRALPSGVQLFSLFEANPSLLDLLSEICALAPNEARILGENHRIFEAVLNSDFYAPLRADEKARHELEEQLAREWESVADYEDALNAVRRFVREAQFRVSVHLLRDLAPMEMIGAQYSLIADIALEALYPYVLSEMERRYGKAPGRGMVVLAMGKLGSREMSRASDLDLVMIYDAQGVEYSDGKRALSASQYYSRFTQNFIQAISVATAEGPLYEVDMRLRPSGRGGPVAVSLQGFDEYQKHEAWTWEHMALLRARVVAGEASLGEDVMRAAAGALSMPREQGKTRHDILEMRGKIRDNFSDIKPLSLKHGAGRMMETELMLQGFGLLGSIGHAGNSMADLLEFSAGHLSEENHAQIGEAMSLYSGLTQLARLSFAGEMPDRLPSAWIGRQAVLTGAKDQAALEAVLQSTAEKMALIFDAQYGEADEP